MNLMNTIDDLIEKLKLSEARHEGRSYDFNKIMQAYETADDALRGQVQLNGAPYIDLPLSEAIILADLGADTDSIVVALLCDTVTDAADCTLDEIRRQFGEEAASLVDGVQKISRLSFSFKAGNGCAYIKNMIDTSMNHAGDDARAIIVMLAKRLHHMRRRAILGRVKRERVAEVMEIYIPIAHNLGIWPVKEELEALCLQCLELEAYASAMSLAESVKAEREQWLNKLILKISEPFPDLHIESRIKGIYSIYKQEYVRNQQGEICDLYRVLLITGSVKECYEVLGYMHGLFRLIHGMFKDFIAHPEPVHNMYQSLHSVLIDEQGRPFMVQIRTRDMHRRAECGRASEGKYLDVNMLIKKTTGSNPPDLHRTIDDPL